MFMNTKFAFMWSKHYLKVTSKCINFRSNNDIIKMYHGVFSSNTLQDKLK